MNKRIIIVDDHILIAKAIEKIISNFEGFEVQFVCSGGEELQNKINKKTPPEIVLLDVSMPGMDGFEVALWLKENYPDVLVMALSMQDDEKSLLGMIKNGAKGYMLKNIQPAELNQALDELVDKGCYFPDWATKKMLTNITGEGIEASSRIKITDREEEFLSYVSTELNYSEIADKMCCSPRTIENYRNSLCEKLGVKTRVGLAVYAVQNGITN